MHVILDNIAQKLLLYRQTDINIPQPEDTA